MHLRSAGNRFGLGFSQRSDENTAFGEIPTIVCAVSLADDAPVDRDTLLRHLLSRGVGAKPGIMLTHRQPPYRDASKDGSARCRALPNSEAAHDHSILLPLYPAMTQADQLRIIDALTADAPC